MIFSLRSLRFFLATIFVVFHSNSFAINLDHAADQILQLFDSNDVVVLGEYHNVSEQYLLLNKIVEKNTRLQKFKVLATESVFSEDQDELTRYISNGDEQFFAKMAQGMKWFRRPEVIRLYRRIWRDKVIHPCGVDVNVLFQDGQKSLLSKELRVSQLAKRFSSFPKEVQEIILKNTGLSESDLIASGGHYEREYVMAQALHSCLAIGEKTLIHVGSWHSASLANQYDRQSPTGRFRATEWLRFLKPDLQIQVVFNAIIPSENDKDGFYTNPTALRDFFLSTGQDHPFLLKSTSLPDQVRQANTITLANGQLIDTSLQADYWVLGPEGSKAEKALTKEELQTEIQTKSLKPEN